MSVWQKEFREILVTLPIAIGVLCLMCWAGTPTDHQPGSNPCSLGPRPAM